MSSRWKHPKPCDHPECKKMFTPNSWNQRYCCVEHKKADHNSAFNRFRKQNPDYWRDYQNKIRATRKRPDSLKPPFNPTPCQYCRRPLGKTFNHFLHKVCQDKLWHLEGLDVYSTDGVRRNGRYQL